MTDEPDKISEADCPNGAGCEHHPRGHYRRTRLPMIRTLEEVQFQGGKQLGANFTSAIQGLNARTAGMLEGMRETMQPEPIVFSPMAQALETRELHQALELATEHLATAQRSLDRAQRCVTRIKELMRAGERA